MKKFFFFPSLFVVSILLFSCKKETLVNAYPATSGLTAANTSTVYGRVGDPGGGSGGDTTVVPNIVTAAAFAGQTINAGSITITNDANNIYVTYSMANGYTLTQTHLYVGPVALIPTNHPGNPMPGQFPYSNVHDHATTFTYIIPVSRIGNNTCGAIAAHATVEKLDAGGQVIDQQSMWGNGPRINGSGGGNWAMYTPFCVQY